MAIDREQSDNFSLEERIEYLKVKIIPKVDRRVRDGRGKTMDEVYKKIFGNGESGELHEFIEGVQKGYEPAHCVSELADLVYNVLQLKSEQLVEDIFELAGLYGVPAPVAVDAAIVKYGERNRTGNKNFGKEHKLIQELLDNHGLVQFNYQEAEEKSNYILTNSDSYQDDAML